MQLALHIRSLGLLGLLVVHIGVKATSVFASKVRAPPRVLIRDADSHRHVEAPSGTAVSAASALGSGYEADSLARSDEISFLGVDRRELQPNRSYNPPCCGRSRQRVRDFFRRFFSPRRHALLTGLRRGTSDLSRQVEKVGALSSLASTALNNLRAILTAYPGVSCQDLRLSQMVSKVEQPLGDARNTRRRVWVSVSHLMEALRRVEGMRGSTLRAAVEEARREVTRASLVLEAIETLTTGMCELCPSSSLCEEALSPTS